jgi:hypothetical protein
VIDAFWVMLRLATHDCIKRLQLPAGSVHGGNEQSLSIWEANSKGKANFHTGSRCFSGAENLFIPVGKV